ncbi:hypothetical protein EC973_000859 [Apophysomyces ossiformis]|uniref:Altered inheritance of mitochondria protein 24, mitochondrial n=1 Tax=Apophysomyces ossiformis TaxID=679940 RepID=A0A8H7BPV8_9FUNG|nr:hypothetical protein EC973_000859 [Apophysomyces ossiformis]
MYRRALNVTTPLARALQQSEWPPCARVASHRSYVGLAFNESKSQPDVPTVDRSLKSFQQTSVGVSGSTISSMGKGSALLVKLPPDAEITAATGSAIAASNKIASKLTLDGTALRAVGKRLLGDPMFQQKFYTRHAAGDLLLAPQRMGEIAIVNLRGSAKYVLRRDAFLAKTEKVTMELGVDGIKGKDTGLVNKLVHTVSGPGTIAISHYGGLYRLSLGAGEEYLANPRRTTPSKLHPKNPVVPSPRSPLRKYNVVKNIVDSPSLQPKLQYLDGMAKSLRNFVLGAPDFVRLRGPGDFYLASRVESGFEKSRLLNALAAVNDSATQLFEQSALFPAPVASAMEGPNAPKKGRHPGYATEKSIDGRPTYYAEVGPKGVVTFVPAKETVSPST